MDCREWEYKRGYVEINLDAIISNMVEMKHHINDNTQMLAVIKTDGYGHGSVPIAQALESLAFIYGFAVATAEEAFELRDANIQKPILVLGYTFPYAYSRLIQENIEMTVFRFDTIEELNEIAEMMGKKAHVHVKVDTGMGRIGVKPDKNGLELINKIDSMNHLELNGVFTHFACADEKNKDSAKKQLQIFQKFLKDIDSAQIIIPLKHCANSASILELPESNMDLVRAGITLYGLMPSSEVEKNILPLTPALSFCSHIVLVKTLEIGESVSYGSTFTATRRTKIATIPIGYGDGYPRSLSNKGYVLIKGKRAPIIGRICMDQFMVDVSMIEEVYEGDLVRSEERRVGKEC